MGEGNGVGGVCHYIQQSSVELYFSENWPQLVGRIDGHGVEAARLTEVLRVCEVERLEPELTWCSFHGMTNSIAVSFATFRAEPICQNLVCME